MNGGAYLFFTQSLLGRVSSSWCQRRRWWWWLDVSAFMIFHPSFLVFLLLIVTFLWRSKSRGKAGLPRPQPHRFQQNGPFTPFSTNVNCIPQPTSLHRRKSQHFPFQIFPPSHFLVSGTFATCHMPTVPCYFLRLGFVINPINIV